MSRSHPEPIRNATIAGLSAYLLWGVSPLFFQLLDFATAAEIVMHRVLWAVPFLAGVLWMSGRLNTRVRRLQGPARALHAHRYGGIDQRELVGLYLCR